MTMIRKTKRATLGALLLALAVVSCSDHDPSGPEELAPVDVGPWESVDAPVHVDTTYATMVDTAGGELRVPASDGNPYGYVLIIEPNTVKRPTRFSVHVGGGKQYLVDLHATQQDPLGREIDVGRGLMKEVVLCMSYHDAADQTIDPARLVILYIPGGGARPQPLPTQVNEQERYVYTPLKHFSKYTMALN